ncbi:MAG: hypothetical protein LBR74_05670 [Eubacterium sp.]|nr:hypothetical protein [Eubacterium sp.]
MSTSLDEFISSCADKLDYSGDRISPLFDFYLGGKVRIGSCAAARRDGKRFNNLNLFPIFKRGEAI